MKTYFIFLSRNKLYTAIQFLGLSIALSFVVLLASYAKTEFSIGNNQPLAQKLYAAGFGERIRMPIGAAPELFPAIPEIASWTRAVPLEELDILVEDDLYQVKAMAVDPNYFEMFTYEWLTPASPIKWIQSDEVVLSEEFAYKAFGNEDPIGQVVNYPEKGKLKVAGVLKSFAKQELLKPIDMIIPVKLVEKDFLWMGDFGAAVSFVVLNEGASLEQVTRKLLDQYMGCWDYWTETNTDNSFTWGASLTRWDELHFSPLNNTGDTLWRKGNRAMVQIFLVVALVLLISALFNYINLAVSQTGKRAHEMATRRLLGDSSGQIVLRYLAESTLFTFTCGAMGYLIAWIIKPYADNLLETQIILVPQVDFVVAFLLFLLFVSVVSGLFPALIVSRFQPLDIVKGSFRLYNKQLFSRVFIVIQNIISTVLIAMGLTMAMQIHHLITLPLGYDTKDMALIRTDGIPLDKQRVLQQRLKALPQVEEIGLTRNIPIFCIECGVDEPDEEKTSWLLLSYMDSVSFNMLGFEVEEQWTEPLPGMLWVTDETRRRYNLSPEKNYFGKNDDGTSTYNVCGVIKEFRSLSPLTEALFDSHNAVQLTSPGVRPFALLVHTRGDYNVAIDAIGKTSYKVCQELLGSPKNLRMFYIDDYISQELKGEQCTMIFVLCFMIISILISAFGLLAMSVSYTEQQSKRIALSKVMGAEVWRVVWSLSKQFVALSLVAALLAIPISILAIRDYLDGFYNRIEFPWYLIVVALFITLWVAFVSIIGQIWRVARRNPVDSLNNE